MLKTRLKVAIIQVPNKVPVARRSQRNPQVKEVKSTVSSGKNKWLHVYQVRMI